MLQVLQVLAVALVAVGLAMVLGHALELPGKLRLPRETYIAVQSIYYPGFTIGAVFGEIGAMVAPRDRQAPKRRPPRRGALAAAPGSGAIAHHERVRVIDPHLPKGRERHVPARGWHHARRFRAIIG